MEQPKMIEPFQELVDHKRKGREQEVAPSNFGSMSFCSFILIEKLKLVMMDALVGILRHIT